MKFAHCSAAAVVAGSALASVAVLVVAQADASGSREPGRQARGVVTERPDAEPYLGLPTTSPVTTPDHWVTVPAFPGLRFDDPVFMAPVPGSDRLWVLEREGRIVSFVNRPDAFETTTVLDIRHQTQGNSDAGLLSMAFHPEFATPGSPNRGFFYVAYAFITDPILDERPGPGTRTRFRLSRFTVPNGAPSADPASEWVLIDQLDQSLWHMAGAMFFHPEDGFLYITLGDEGGGGCGFDNCQRIDRDLFAGVLRIDVDRRGGAISHPIVRQPDSGATTGYFVPNDNPFVGLRNVMEEFYAIGLRSPHRMTHDAIDGLTWIADVGQSGREEIDLLSPAANFQWNILEGTVPFRDGVGPPDPLIGVWTDPLHDYGRRTGGTVIGGYVYRGEEHFALYGKYVFGDYLSGRVWALSYEKAEDGVEKIGVDEMLATSFRGSSDGITSFAADHHGELYILTLGDEAVIHKLVICDKEPGDVPLLLSETGLFADLATLTPRPALVPYDVNAPLWSDGAVKSRWFAVPSGEKIGFSASRPWRFPPGSVFVKHFELPTDEREPTLRRRLETRVLVAQADGEYYGVTYRWREDQSDADLLVSSFTEDVEVTRADGTTRTQRYRYPSPTDCLRCHSSAAGRLLGIKSHQLKGRIVDPAIGTSQDQLQWLSDVGFFDIGLGPDAIDLLDELAALDDDSVPLRKRVRSYLDSNCAQCHGAEDLERSLWDARYTTPLVRQGIVRGSLLGEYEGKGNHVVTPGDLERSILYRRVVSVDRDLRMPPIGRNEQDLRFIEILERWILSLDDGTTTSTTLPPDVCGDPAEPFGSITLADTLTVLRAVVEDRACLACECDVNGDGDVTVTDALMLLRRAVQTPVTFACVPCS